MGPLKCVYSEPTNLNFTHVKAMLGYMQLINMCLSWIPLVAIAMLGYVQSVLVPLGAGETLCST